jgi:hypothetical protein
MDYILARLKEPSTWTGLGAAIAGVLHLTGSASASIVALIVAAGGVIGMILPEGKTPPKAAS